jgi:2-keto-3-deoxy-L-rhamnonate aldolase RhmA
MTFELEPWLAAKTRNPVLERLAKRLPVTAFGVRGARTSEIARIARAAGNDVIWIDLEHSTMSTDVAAQICAAALDIGVFPLVRVPEKDYGVIGRLLDGGARGIIAPRIETAAQAAEVAGACRFPPHGQRSAIATLPHLELRRVPAARLNQAMNGATLVKVLIETPLGLENLEAIASLQGVDLIGIGANDLTAELGFPGEYDHPDVRRALEGAIRVCNRVGKPLAIGGIPDPVYSAALIELGAAPFFFTGIDTDVLLVAAQERVRQALASHDPRRP